MVCGGSAGKRFAAKRTMWLALAGFVLIELEPISVIISSWWRQPSTSPDPRALLGVEGLANIDYGRGVPRVLHQTWKGHQPPAELEGYINSWHVQNPTLQHVMWNDTEGLGLIEREYPWFWEHMVHFKSGVEKADIMRYFILYHHGGIYADLDMEAVRPIEPLLQKHDRRFGVALGTEPFDHAQAQNGRNMLVCNAILISTPKHPFWLAVFSQLLKEARRLKTCRQNDNCGDISPVDTTGPVMLTRVYETEPAAFLDVMLYPSNVFYPLKDGDSKYKPIDPARHRYENTYAVHRWHHLWFGRSRQDKINVHPWDRTEEEIKTLKDDAMGGGGGGWGPRGPGGGDWGMRDGHGTLPHSILLNFDLHSISAQLHGYERHSLAGNARYDGA